MARTYVIVNQKRASAPHFFVATIIHFYSSFSHTRLNYYRKQSSLSGTRIASYYCLQSLSFVHSSCLLLAFCNGYHVCIDFRRLRSRGLSCPLQNNTLEFYSLITLLSPYVRFPLLFPLLVFRDQHISDSLAKSTSTRLYSTSVLVVRYRRSLMKSETSLHESWVFCLYNRSTRALITQRL